MNKLCWIIGFTVAAIGARGLAADKTYKPNDEGFILNWLILDPIALDEKAQDHTEESEKEFFDKEHFKGQKAATPKAGDKIKVEGEELTWRTYESPDSMLDFRAFADEQGTSPDQCIFLGVAYIIAEKEISGIKLSTSTDDSGAWSLNGKELIRMYGWATDPDHDQSTPITLKVGVNILTFSVINGGGASGLYCRFLDKNDNPVTKGYVISLTPPEKK